MTRRFVIAAGIVAACVLGSSAPASAQKMYKWTDKDGKIHFSNVSPEGNATTVESEASPAGVEARGAEPGGAPAAPVDDGSAASTAAASTSSGSESAVADEMFSNRASATRLRLKRELANAKENAQAATDKLEALRRERDKPPQMGVETLVAAYGKPQRGEEEEDALRKEKERADKRVEDIRQEYSDLHAEAVKRLGHEPSWWLPLE